MVGFLSGQYFPSLVLSIAPAAFKQLSCLIRNFEKRENPSLSSGISEQTAWLIKLFLKHDPEWTSNFFFNGAGF